MFYIRGAAVAALMSLSVSAFGQSCPWSGPVQVKAKISSVTVNGIYYDVQGPNDRRTFSDILANCGATEAAIHFDRWRNARIATNATAVGGVAVDNRIFAGSLAGGIAAGVHKRDFRRALERQELP